MSYNNDLYVEDSNIIYIDGTQEELIPGLNAMMARMAELYIENYIDQDNLDGLDNNETIIIDYTALSEEEMCELVACAVTSLEIESDYRESELLLS